MLCYNLALQLMIFCIITHIPFSLNKSYFHFKGKSSISIPQFNNVNFQIKQFFIFEKLWWNSVQPICGAIMNLIEITYTKQAYYTKISENKATLFFYRRKQTKSLTQKQWKIYAKSVKRSVAHLCFISRIPKFNNRRTRNERL